MKKIPSDPRGSREGRVEEARQRGTAAEPSQSETTGGPAQGGAPESAASRESFPQRKRKPGQVGLANEARPGLGTRGDNVDPASGPEADAGGEQDPEAKPEATEHGYEEPRPEPREQAPDSLAHDQERSTGVSGQSSGG